jgi:hypothetical protein
MSKRQILLPEAIAKAKYLVRATLRNRAGTKVSGVLCGVFLPERLTDPIKLHFQPTPKQARLVEFARLAAPSYELSFSATTRTGGRRIKFSADRLWCSSMGSGHHDGIPFVSDFTGEPTDFDVIHYGLTAGPRLSGTFFLTPNTLINTAMIVSRSYTGTVRIRHVCRPRFSLRSGVRLAFTKHFRHREGEHDETISFSELVAEFQAKKLDISATSEDLDNFLLLTSFATRHRCVCMGWMYTNSRGDMVEHYRRDIAIPKEKEISTNDTLIDITEFPKFIRAAYRRFCRFTEKDQFKSAIYPLISDANSPTEMSYFGLFSALESALLFADRTFHLFPTGHQRLHERWRLFQAKYAVDVSDLWPLTDKTSGVTLAGLRNKVAHGEYLNPAQTLALLYARQHLRWTVERVVLSLLGWPIPKSKVRPSFLGHMHTYHNWKQSRLAF